MEVQSGGTIMHKILPLIITTLLASSTCYSLTPVTTGFKSGSSVNYYHFDAPYGCNTGDVKFTDPVVTGIQDPNIAPHTLCYVAAWDGGDQVVACGVRVGSVFPPLFETEVTGHITLSYLDQSVGLDLPIMFEPTQGQQYGLMYRLYYDNNKVLQVQRTG